MGWLEEAPGDLDVSGCGDVVRPRLVGAQEGIEGENLESESKGYF